MTPATLRALAGEPAVMCMDCEKARPAKGYDLCCECQARFLLDNPAELAEWLACGPVDEWDREILELIADRQTEPTELARENVTAAQAHDRAVSGGRKDVFSSVAVGQAKRRMASDHAAREAGNG